MDAPENAPFFQKELADIIGVTKAYGVGISLKAIAEGNPNVSLSTMKALFAGKHIRPQQFLSILSALSPRPLDRIESKVRYVEAFLNEYLVNLTPHFIETHLNRIDLKAFFNLRQDNLELFPTRQARLSSYITCMFKKAGLTPGDIADSKGPKAKKDIHSISYPTLTAIRRGEAIKPGKFNLVCRRLGVEKDNRNAAKILFGEAYLGEYLLDEDPAVFKRLKPVDYPRICALLIFSAQERLYLP